jgi:Putative restriction endonuclease
MTVIPLEREIEDATSDSQPLEETSLQRVMTDVIRSFEQRYAGAQDTWVGGGFLLCYREGDPKAVVVPDVAVVKGRTEESDRSQYLLWNEGRPPCLVLEVTCRETRREDTAKRRVYEQLGVDEIFLFDPTGEYLQPRFQGFRLQRDRYVAIPAEVDGACQSWTTGVRLRPEGLRLRVIDMTKGRRYPWPDEIEAARRKAEARLAKAASRQSRG